MRITLVHPAGSNYVPGKKDVTTIANRMVPIGLLSLAGYLERCGHVISVLDCPGPKAPPTIAGAISRVLAQRPDLVGFSTTTSSFLGAYDMAVRIKTAAPGIAIVFGGVHPSSLGAALLEKYDAIDFLAVGEGEVTLRELADGISHADIEGLVWRDQGQVRTNRPRVHLPTLDDLPFPAYHLLEGFPHGYRLPPFSYTRTPGTAISTSRGCVYQCSYCDRSVFRKGFRSNGADYTYRHLQLLRQVYGIRHVNIYDDLFTVNRQRVLELCDRLAAQPLGMQFNCAVRVGHVDDELLSALKKAGCLLVSIGVESGDPALLEDLKAGVTLAEVTATIARIQGHGLWVKGLFMMGVVGETEASIQKTSDFIVAAGFDDMNMAKFTPFPGAPCFASIREHGTFEENWNLMNALNFVFVPTGIASKERLNQLYNTHVKRFYTSPGWRRKLTRRLLQHRATLWYVIKNLPSFLAAKRDFEPAANE